ncbi:uncharacterized protein LOC111059183 [Nilaparvata lugens]|uniref:uncharacterized protein LOC111059183 n=1 Tax=Nilaparvata lugens TaxID=108931 RepID=UPI00193DFF12|nr:uncharacterized protein LOC111059183 [Nilaparvata lugens]
MLSDKLFTCIIKPEEAQDFFKLIHRLDLGNPLIEPYRPQLNEMVAIYCVHTDPFWRRGIVLSESNGLFNLALVDFGLPVISKDLKKMSGHMENIPLLSVNLRLNSSPSSVIQQEDVLRVTLVKKLTDSGEWEAEMYSTGDEPKHLGAGRVSRWNIEPDQVPELATSKLKSGDVVVISSFQEINKMYVRPANPELAEFYLMLEADVAAEFTLSNCLGRPPFMGELVAVVWHHDCKHYRARILEKTDKKDYYKVLFVDHGNTDIIHTSRMMLISNKLKSIPVCAIEVGLADIEFKTLTPAAYDYIIKLAAQEELLIITFENHKEVQLTKVSDKTDLNRKIRDLLEPSWLREPHFNTSLALQTYPMLLDLPLPSEENRFKIGETESIILSYVPPFDSSTVHDGRIQLVACKASKALIVTYTKVLCDQMSEYIASRQNGEEINKYVPHRGELCVCLGEDNIPVRAECVSLLNDKSARLAYIDYGHQVDVKFERIYKMTNDLMQLPAYATYCYADGFPADTTPEKLAAAYNELNFCDAEIKGFENEHYNIFIPELIARV